MSKFRKSGLKEVADVIFFDLETKKPAILFNTLKVSTIENESESAEARGGRGNGKLMSWDYGRTATLTLSDALISDVSLAMLAGTAVKEAGTGSTIKVVETENKTVGTGGKVTLNFTPVKDSVSAFTTQNGIMVAPIEGLTVTDKEVTFGTVPAVGTTVTVFYEREVSSNASLITFSARQFPKTYRVVGSTIVRGEDGVDRKMQFVIHKAKLQTSFSLTMDAENVSTFDFTLDVLTDTTTDEFKLYDIIRID